MGLGHCDTCSASFPYLLIHNGFNESQHAYCSRCGITAFVSSHEAHRRVGNALGPHGPVAASIEPLLAPCACGGHFERHASPRCPDCRAVLSASAATAWLEHDAPGTAQGWRWQRSWDGLYCIIIDNRSVSDPWSAPTPGKQTGA